MSDVIRETFTFKILRSFKYIQAFKSEPFKLY